MKQLLLNFSLLLVTNDTSAMLVRPGSGPSPTMVSATGPIVSGDLARLRKAFEPSIGMSPKPGRSATENLLFINTDGGDLKEAMAIGRWVRQNRVSVVIVEESNCYSSCVYILAAAVSKYPGGDVGIHRPYLVKQPSASFDLVMKRALRDSQAYFTEMNIPAQLADAMFSIPPEQLEVLDKAKLSFYRLDQDDFAYREEQDMQSAARYGMTRQEYIVRWNKYKTDAKVCESIKDSIASIKCDFKHRVRYGFRKPGLD
jgi:hypothetical protein